MVRIAPNRESGEKPEQLTDYCKSYETAALVMRA